MLDHQTTDAAAYCRNMPPPPLRAVARDHLIEEVRRNLDGRFEIVVLVGDPLTGKTELASEFVRRYPNSSVGVFLSPDSGPFRNPEYIRLTVAEQISWIVDKQPLNEELVSEEQYRRYLYKLQKHARARPITWIIDGLGQGTSGSDQSEFAELIDPIPLSSRDFRFILTAEADLLPRVNKTGRPSRAMDIMMVSPDEARQFFADLIDNPQDIEEIRSFCLSSVGRMQRIRALLTEGNSIEQLLQSKNPSLDAIFDFEWTLFQHSSTLTQILSLLAFCNYPLTEEKLAKLCLSSTDDVQRLTAPCRLIYRQTTPAVAYSLVESKAIRSFVARKMHSYEQEARDALVQTLLDAPTSVESTQFLPVHLAKAGRHQELLRYLDAQHFARVLKNERTLKALRQHAWFGCAAARQLTDHPAELAFSLIGSAFSGLTFSVATADHISVLVALGNTDAAIELASIAPTSEERLKHLAAAGCVLLREKRTLPQEVREQLSSLVNEVDPESLGELGVDICTDLVSIDPRLAAALMAKLHSASKLSKDDSLGAGDEPHSDGRSTQTESKTRQLGSKILPPHKLRDYQSALARHFQSIPGEVLLKRLRDERPELALELAKQWLVSNRKSADACKVADFALDFLLAASDRTPTLADLRTIASVLEGPPTPERKQILDRLQTQFRILSHHGTNVDAVRIRMRLLAARHVDDPGEVELGLIDLHTDIHKLEDLATRSACWAWFLHHLDRFPELRSIEKSIGIQADAAIRLNESIDELLQSSAGQYDVAREAIGALARSDARSALTLCARLNTADARESAYEALARNLVDRFETSSVELITCISGINSGIRRDQLILYTLGQLNKLVRQRAGTTVPAGLTDLWKLTGVAVYRMQALCAVAALMQKQGNTDGALSLLPTLHELWDSVHTPTLKVQVGYLVANELASIDARHSSEWLARTQQLQATRPAPSESLTEAMCSATRLAVRLFPCLQKDSDRGSDTGSFSRMTSLIGALQDCEYEVRLWSELAVRLYFQENQELAKRIAEEHLWPMLEGYRHTNPDLVGVLAVEAAPALYLANPSRTRHFIDNLPVHQRDFSRALIARTLYTKLPHREPYHSYLDAEFKLDTETVSQLLDLTHETVEDSSLYQRVDELCRSLGSDKNRTSLQRNAVVEHLRKLESICRAKLPYAHGISHEGFLIASLAQIAKIRNKVQGDTVQSAGPEWDRLFAQARAIPNVADRAVVTAIVGANGRARPGSALSDWLTLVRQDIADIPSGMDRLDRYEWIARIVGRVDRAMARVLVSEGVKLSNLLPATDDLREDQRGLLDFAHSLDPELAKQLVAKLDADEARKEQLHKRLEATEKRRESAAKPDAFDFFGMDDDQVADLCNSNLGSLNAGRIPVKQVEDFLQLTRRARQMPLDDAHWAWAWICQNAVRRRMANSSDKLGAKLFDAAAKACEIGRALIGQLPRDFRGDLGDGTVKPGEREQFFAKLQGWAAKLDGNVVLISDPYFSPADLEVVKIMAEASPGSSFRILTSKEQMRKKKLTEIDDAFRDAWDSISDVDPPEIELSVIGYGTEGKHPIHDRWLLTKESGLKLGSSINSLGLTRISDVSEMDSPECHRKTSEILNFLDSPPRAFGGERLTLTTVRV